MTQVLRMFTSLLLLLGCSLLSHGVFAVQLGDLQLQSALNQPLSGEFTLRRSEGFAINELTVELAPEADFKRLGVERIAALNDLKFNVRARGSGDYVVEVTSSMPVVDPFLDFVVQARWPAGRVLRIYTALLDPLAVPTRSDSTRQAAEGKPAPVTSPGADAAAYGPVTRGDTLWSIASHLKTSLGVTVHQAMLALQRANPGAFGNNNVNLLKNGHVLRIPDLHEFRVYSPEEAFAEVRRQYREYGIVDLPDWQRGAQGSSGTRVETASGDELRLTRADRSNVDQTGPDNPGSEPGNTDTTRSDSGAIKESLDELQRANQTLTSDVKALSTQIETLNKLVVLKDDQIVALEGELQKLQKPQKSQTAPTGTTAIWAWPGEKALGEFTASLDEFFKEFELDEFFKEFELNEFFKESELDEFFKESELSVLVQDPLLASGAVLLLLLVVMLMYWLVLLNRRPVRSRAPLSTGPGTPMLRVPARDDREELIRVVDLHLAYGRFDEAAKLLGQGMKAQPKSTDIMLRLLEVYQRQGDASAFSRQLERLRQTGDEYAIEQALVLEQAMTPSGSPDESAVVPDDESVVPAQADVAEHSAVDTVEEGSGKPDAEAEKGPAAQSGAEGHAEGHAHAGSKIDLARAYIEMGDEDRARALLQAVLSYGIEPDVTEAKALLARLA